MEIVIDCDLIGKQIASNNAELKILVEVDKLLLE